MFSPGGRVHWDYDAVSTPDPEKRLAQRASHDSDDREHRRLHVPSGCDDLAVLLVLPERSHSGPGVEAGDAAPCFAGADAAAGSSGKDQADPGSTGSDDRQLVRGNL